MADGRARRRHLRLALRGVTEPEWELPKIPESEDAAFAFHAPEYARWRFRSHPQEVFENSVDIAHFATVHGCPGSATSSSKLKGTACGRSRT